MKIYSPSGVSFFTARDTIITEKHRHGVSFESNIRNVPQIGQVSLLFVKFHAFALSRAYERQEKIYTIGRGGKPALVGIGDLETEDFYEIMILLKGFSHDSEDPLLCNLWVKNTRVLFSSYLEPKTRQNMQSTLFFGGLKWFTTELRSASLGRLQIITNMHLLSSLYLSFDKLPMQFEIPELPEDDAFLAESW